MCSRCDHLRLGSPLSSGPRLSLRRPRALLGGTLGRTGCVRVRACLPRRRTGLSAKHQRRIAQTIKIARQLALLPYTEKLVRK